MTACAHKCCQHSRDEWDSHPCPPEMCSHCREIEAAREIPGQLTLGGDE